MALLSLPFPNFVNGTTADATQVDQNNAAIVAQVNNINSANIGTLGIYASQIIPTSGAQSTFGGTLGYTFLAPATGVTPLTVSGVAGQSVDIFDVTLTSGGTKSLSVDSAGRLNFGAATAGVSASAVTIQNDNGATNGMFLNVPAGSTAGFRFGVNGSSVTAISNSGLLSAIGLVSQGSTVIAAGTGTVSAVPGLANGDVVAQRSATTGRFSAGGTSAGTWDYNILNANSWTAQNSSTFADIFAAVYHNASDVSLKSNIAPLASSLQNVLALKPSTYIVNNTGKQRIGVIAQDVQEILPMLVATDTDGLLSVDTFGVTIALLKAFQEYVLAHP